ncbi:hypothetical protein AX14_005023 [Amanita brunnescens Koide BX004]|nr:hypothetical protein AX14_005023 [Amanita brunnescens Koide BX004]
MCDEEGAVSSRRVNCYVFSPEDRRHDLAPLASVAVGSLNERFADIEVSSLHNAVSLGVVGQDVDMIDAILLSQNVECGEVRRAVVGDDSVYSSMVTKHIFENELGDT